MPFQVTNPWFTGGTDVHTFSREEILATKLRALLQRDKGRDLYDLAHALDTFEGLDTARVAVLFARYLDLGGTPISRAQAQERMFAKLGNPRFILDLRPLLPAPAAEALTDQSALQHFASVFSGLIDRLPGDPWARTDEMKERFQFPVSPHGNLD